MQDNALATQTQQRGLVINPSDQKMVDLIRNTYVKGGTDEHLKLFIATANRTGLDPIRGEICAVIRNGRDGPSMSIQTMRDGYRVIASRTGETAGQDAPEWCDKNGKWTDVWLSDTPPAAARVKVWRKGYERPFVGIAPWKEFNNPNNPLYAKMPAHMLAKCAETQALKKAFPNETAGISTAEEVEITPTKGDGKKIDINTVKSVQGRVVDENPPLKDANPAQQTAQTAAEPKPFESELRAERDEWIAHFKKTLKEWYATWSPGVTKWADVNHEAVYKNMIAMKNAPPMPEGDPFSADPETGEVNPQ